MTANEQSLEDPELTDWAFEFDSREVINDFGGQTVSSFRTKIAEGGSMDLMFSYSVISKKGFAHFLPAVDDYARSRDSELDCEFPGSFAHAVGNQLRINPEAIFSVCEQVESLSQWIFDNLGKFDQGEDWEQDTSLKLMGILEVLRQNKRAEQAMDCNPH